jgi:hypothetical protein
VVRQCVRKPLPHRDDDPCRLQKKQKKQKKKKKKNLVHRLHNRLLVQDVDLRDDERLR